jgi:hypothetical protein
MVFAKEAERRLVGLRKEKVAGNYFVPFARCFRATKYKR